MSRVLSAHEAGRLTHGCALNCGACQRWNAKNVGLERFVVPQGYRRSLSPDALIALLDGVAK
jgi:hypothetical protein